MSVDDGNAIMTCAWQKDASGLCGEDGINEDKTGQEGPLELEMLKVRTRAVISGLARRHPAIFGW